MILNNKTALAMLTDFGASHTIIGIYDRNKDLVLLNSPYIQNGMIPSLLYLHADLKIDLESSNSVFVFDKLKYNFLNQKIYYVDEVLRTQKCNSLEEARTIYNNDVKKFTNDNANDLKNYDLSKCLFFEFKNGLYKLKLIIKIGINELIQIFFKRLKQQVFVQTGYYANAIIYAVPAYLSHELRALFSSLLQECDLYPLLEITEPEASLLCYDDLLTNNSKYLVIDSGASTTDLCVVTKEDNKLVISAMRGNNECGGILIDEGIKQFWKEKNGGFLPKKIHEALLSAKVFLNNPNNHYEDFYYYEEKLANGKVLPHCSLDADFELEKVKNLMNKKQKDENTNLKNEVLAKQEDKSKDKTNTPTSSLPLVLHFESNYKQNKVSLNFNKLALNNNYVYGTTPDKEVNYSNIYKLSYADYILCANIFFQRYISLLNDLNNINVQGIVLSGGSNLNLFISNYLKQEQDIMILNNHIFDSVINGLYVAYNKKTAGKLNIIHNNPIDLIASFNNTSKTLLREGAILPAHIEITITNIKTDFDLFLGVSPNTAKIIQARTHNTHPLNYQLTPTLPLEEGKQSQTLRLKIDVSSDYVFKISIISNDFAYEPLTIRKFAFSEFNLIYLQLSQEEINVYNYLKDIQPYYINQKYQKDIDDLIVEKNKAEQILAKQDFNKYHDDIIIEKVEGANGLYYQFKEFDDAYKKLLEDLANTRDDYNKKNLYEYFLNTAFSQLQTSLQFFYQLQAIISGKEAPLL